MEMMLHGTWRPVIMGTTKYFCYCIQPWDHVKCIQELSSSSSPEKVVKLRITRPKRKRLRRARTGGTKGGNAASVPADVMVSATTQKLNTHP